MKIVFLASALSLVALPAFAQSATSSSTSGAASNSNSAASAGAIGVGVGVGGRSVSSNSNVYRQKLQPGAVGLPGLAASSGCMGSTSAGVGFPGGSIGLGSTWQDQRCNAREDARLLAAFGYPHEALQLLINASPQVQQVMGPPVAAVAPRGAYKPVSLGNDQPYVNGVQQVYRGSATGLSEKCQATLGLLQQQDAYLKNLVSKGKANPSKLHNASLVQQNLRTGVSNLQVLCPATLAKQAGDEILGRINQIDQYLSTGRWTGPVG